MGRPRSYDYAKRDGVRYLSWEEVATLSHALAERLDGNHLDLVVGIARAGLFPAFVIASALRRELCVVRLSRRVDGDVAFDHPVWHIPVPSTVAGKVVAVVDEIADSGETLELVRASVTEHGAAQVATAALITHSWAEPRPDVVALVSDELVVFPWYARIFVDGHWTPHPEVEAAIQAQRRPPSG